MDEVPLYLAHKKTPPPGPYTRPMTRELWIVKKKNYGCTPIVSVPA